MARWTPPQAGIQVKTGENEMEQSVEKIIERNLEMAIGPSSALPISALYDGNLLDNPTVERHLLCGRA